MGGSDQRLRLLDTILRGLFFLGLGSLLFIAGAAALHFKWQGMHRISEGFESGKAWFKEWQREPLKISDSSVAGLSVRITSWDPTRAYEGYTLLSYANSSTVYLIDMRGRVVHQWHIPFLKAWPNPIHVNVGENVHVYIKTARVFPNGDLIVQYSAIGSSPYGYGMAKIDKNSNLLWKFSENAHHDFYIEPNGNIVVLTHQFIHTSPSPRLDSFMYPLLVDYIVTLSPAGKVLDRVSVMDAFVDTPYESYLFSRHIARIPKKKEWDLMHTNSLVKVNAAAAKRHPQFKENQWLISIKNPGALAVIDPTSKKVVWAYRGFWNFIHAAQFTPEGDIMVFDNQGYIRQQAIASRVFAFDPFTNQVTWQYAGTSKRLIRSFMHDRLQPLPNGNLLIGIGMQSHVVEVTQEGEVVWDLIIGSARWLGSATRYSPKEILFLKP